MEVTNSNDQNQNLESNSNISPDIDKLPSNENMEEIVDNISSPLSQNIITSLIIKDDQSNTERKYLKNHILKIEAQMSALKSHVKCELSTLANKTETMPLNL